MIHGLIVSIAVFFVSVLIVRVGLYLLKGITKTSRDRLKIRSILIYFLSFSFTCCFISIMFPYRFPLFPLVTLFLLFAIYIFRKGNLKFSAIAFLMFFLLVDLYLVGVIKTGTVYKLVLGDISKSVSMFIFLVAFYNIINNLRDFQLFYKVFVYSCFLASVAISIVGLYKFFLLTVGIKIPFFFSGSEYPWGTSLVSDYNFFSLGLLSGLICGYEILSKYRLCLLNRIIAIMEMSLIILIIIFSGSRRGFIILLIVIFILALDILKFSVKSFVQFTKDLKINKKFITNLIAISFCLLAVVLTFKNMINTFLISSEYVKIIERIFTLESMFQKEGSFSERIKKWSYASELFNEYSLSQIFLGKNFDYLKLFQWHFSENTEDYPHNIFISQLLFSGVFGLSILISFYLYCSALHFKYLRYTRLISVIYFISIGFVLTSANTFLSAKLHFLTAIMPLVLKNKIKIKRTFHAPSSSNRPQQV